MKKKKVLFAIGIMATLILTSCKGEINSSGQRDDINKEQVSETKMSEYVKITAKEAKEIMDTVEDYTLIDVRTTEEYNEGHIKGAMLLSYDTIEDLAAKELQDKNALILVYCRSGNRSEKASRKLLELGYTNVKDFGGINDWPYEIIKE